MESERNDLQQRQVNQSAADLIELRGAALSRLALIVGAAGFAWLLLTPTPVRPAEIALSVALVALGMSVGSLHSRLGPLYASLLLMGGLLPVTTAAIWLYPGRPLAPLLTLLVLFASALLGPIAGGCMTVTSALLLTILRVRWPAVVSADLFWVTLPLLVLTEVSVWFFDRPLATTLTWTWKSYELARQEREKALEQRGELRRLSKELENAVQRLEKMNVELERARRAAEEAWRLKANFAAAISHELRTPLNLIVGFSEMIVAAPHSYGVPLPRAYRKDLESIYRNAQQLSSLIDDVLDLSKIEAGRMRLNREATQLATVVTEAVDMMASLVKNKGLTLNVNVTEGLPPLLVDRTRVRQIIINLMNNCVRFTDTGSIAIEAWVSESDVIVAVRDTGIGIAEKDLPSVFEEFHQFDTAAGSRRGGTGLGLTISKQFVELHGGQMWVESKLGEGSTFYFSLPVEPGLVVQAVQRPWETWVRLRPTTGEPARAVVVVGEEAAVRLFQRDLEGYQVIGVREASDVSGVVAQQPVYAVIEMTTSTGRMWQQLRQARRNVHEAITLVCRMPRPSLPSRYELPFEVLVKPLARERLASVLQRLESEMRSFIVACDDLEVARLLQHMLYASLDEGCQVQQVYNGAQAIALLEVVRPDAIFLDLQESKPDAYDVVEWMQQDADLCTVPAIVLTTELPEATLEFDLVGLARRKGFSFHELVRGLGATLDALSPHLPRRAAEPPVEPAA